MSNQPCPITNGSYSCDLPPEHEGLRTTTYVTRGHQNEVIRTTKATWSDGYSRIKFHSIAAGGKLSERIAEAKSAVRSSPKSTPTPTNWRNHE